MVSSQVGENLEVGGRRPELTGCGSLQMCGRGVRGIDIGQNLISDVGEPLRRSKGRSFGGELARQQPTGGIPIALKLLDVRAGPFPPANTTTTWKMLPTSQ